MKRMYLLVVALLVVACGPQTVKIAAPSSGRDVSDYTVWAQDFVSRWDDAVAIANVTGRGYLAGPVADLQELKREAMAYQSSDTSVIFAHSFLVSAVDAEVRSFLAFMAEDSPTTISQQGLYDRSILRWSEELAKIAQD